MFEPAQLISPYWSGGYSGTNKRCSQSDFVFYNDLFSPLVLINDLHRVSFQRAL